MKEEDYSKAIEVFSGSPWEAEIIKGLLESNDIRCVIKDGIMGTLAPYIAPHRRNEHILRLPFQSLYRE